MVSQPVPVRFRTPDNFVNSFACFVAPNGIGLEERKNQRRAFFVVFFVIIFSLGSLSNAGIRFKSDFAPGATANALESISQARVWIAGLAAFFGGTGIAIIDKLAQIHHRLSQ